MTDEQDPKKKLTRQDLLAGSDKAIAKIRIKPEHYDDLWKLDLTDSTEKK